MGFQTAFASGECSTSVKCDYGVATCTASAKDKDRNPGHASAICGIMTTSYSNVRSCARTFMNDDKVIVITPTKVTKDT